jgi:hypothetical protein
MSNSARWIQSREQLSLSDDLVKQRRYEEAVKALDEAHNLGRDHIELHARSHIRYVKFSFWEGNYKRALGHVFWSFTSPYYVPRDRRKRTEVATQPRKAPIPQ